MRILIVGHTVARGDGQGRINLEIARHCLARGHALTVFGDEVEASLAGNGAVVVRPARLLRKPGMAKVQLFLRAANRFVDRTRRDYDVIVANGSTLTRPHDLNLCQFVHRAWAHSPVHVSRVQGGWYGLYQKTYTWQNQRLERHAYAAAAAVVAPSKQIQRELISIGVSENRVRLIYNGVDLEEFQPRSVDARERAALGLPRGVPTALFVGDIRTTRKNLDTVLAAVARTPRCHLAVVGAMARSPFPSLAERLGVKDRVHFLNFRRDVPQLMAACEVFTFPSRYEAGSLVLMEAMASGLPIITAKSAGGSELVNDACGVVLNDPEDVASLAKALDRLTADLDLRTAMGRQGRVVAEQHGWSAMAQHYLDLLEQAYLRGKSTSDPVRSTHDEQVVSSSLDRRDPLRA